MLYEVDLHKTIAYTVQVQANSEEEAIELAEQLVQDECLDDLNEWDEIGNSAIANPAED